MKHTGEILEDYWAGRPITDDDLSSAMSELDTAIEAVDRLGTYWHMAVSMMQHTRYGLQTLKDARERP
jgi:hypothetical protein